MGYPMPVSARRALPLVLAGILAGCLAAPGGLDAPARWERMDPALAPEMGWNSWLLFGEKVHPDPIRAMADALVRLGLDDLGYRYVVIDGGWWTQGASPGRDANGNIVPDPEFADMKALVDHIHALGLKAGIYTDVGSTGCGTQWGSYGHYERDAAQFAEWGFDFVKVDFCGGLREGLDPAKAYGDFRKAMDAHPKARAMRMNVCEWGHAKPWGWAPGIGAASWRTGSDISPEWVNWPNIVRNFDANDHPEAAGPGHWNDPDHVVVGVWPGNLTAHEERAHFSMWAIQSAPLQLATNLIAPEPNSLSVISNDEVILVDQDALGEQGRRSGLALAPDVEVWVKNVTGPGKAILVLNRGEIDRSVTLRWADVGAGDRTRVRDLWVHRDVDPGPPSVTVALAPHGAAMWRVDVAGPAADRSG